MIAGGGLMVFALSVGMLAAFVLGFAGVRLIVTKQDRQRGLLMIGASVVLVLNVLIWVWPIRP